MNGLFFHEHTTGTFQGFTNPVFPARRGSCIEVVEQESKIAVSAVHVTTDLVSITSQPRHETGDVTGSQPGAFLAAVSPAPTGRPANQSASPSGNRAGTQSARTPLNGKEEIENLTINFEIEGEYGHAFDEMNSNSQHLDSCIRRGDVVECWIEILAEYEHHNNAQIIIVRDSFKNLQSIDVSCVANRMAQGGTNSLAPARTQHCSQKIVEREPCPQLDGLVGDDVEEDN